MSRRFKIKKYVDECEFYSHITLNLMVHVSYVDCFGYRRSKFIKSIGITPDAAKKYIVNYPNEDAIISFLKSHLSRMRKSGLTTIE